MGAELFRADRGTKGRADGHDKDHSRFSELCKRSRNDLSTILFQKQYHSFKCCIVKYVKEMYYALKKLLRWNLDTDFYSKFKRLMKLLNFLVLHFH